MVEDTGSEEEVGIEAVLDALADAVAMRIGRRGPSRLTYTRAEAAEAMGCSVDHFQRHIQAHLRLVRSGRLVLVPVSELVDYIDRVAEYTLPPHR